MGHRPTLKDVAREAAVSMATVNRVVGGAANVREETVRRVAEAAARVGYHGQNLIGSRLQGNVPEVRLGFVLHKEKQDFYQTFADGILASAQRFTGANIRPKIIFSSSQAPNDTAEHFRSLIGHCDVVAATAVNHHVLDDAVRDLHTAGIPCFSLLSDFAQGIRQGYIGLNNLKVGRGAARMLSVAVPRPGKIALFVGGHRWHGHELRETGFRSFFREVGPGFEVLDTLVNLETRALTYEATLDLLSRFPDLAGVYLAGGGMEGAIVALREERPPRKVGLIVNESTPESHRAMEDGYVTAIVATPLGFLCDKLIEMMVHAKISPERKDPSQVFLDPVLLLPEFF